MACFFVTFLSSLHLRSRPSRDDGAKPVMRRCKTCRAVPSFLPARIAALSIAESCHLGLGLHHLQLDWAILEAQWRSCFITAEWVKALPGASEAFAPERGGFQWSRSLTNVSRKSERASHWRKLKRVEEQPYAYDPCPNIPRPTPARPPTPALLAPTQSISRLPAHFHIALGRFLPILS